MDFSPITDQLLIGTTPNQADYEQLSKFGVRLVINMRFWRGRPPAHDELGGLTYLRLPTFDSPLLPIPIGALRRGTRAALEVMSQGGKVYVHCSRGRHRSAAMAAAILIAQGMTPEQSIQRIKARRRIADPDAAYIRARILEFSRSWAHG